MFPSEGFRLDCLASQPISGAMEWSRESSDSFLDSRSSIIHDAENFAHEKDLSRSSHSSVSLEENSKLQSVAAGMIGKRRYTYKTRKKSDRFLSSLQLRRASKLRKIESPSFSFSSAPCCKRSCITDADHEFLSTQVEKALQMNQEERRNYLSRMMHGTKRKHFQFNEKRVCTQFLLKHWNWP